MAKQYDHKSIETKWQHFWQENATFKAPDQSKKPKYYVLDMFPFPSGSGLHVGHVTGYTATDVVARAKRHQGFNVLHPMGWDSFGLPAEQFAIRTGQHPSVSVKSNSDTYRRQLKSLGFSYDWDREIATTDSSYVKWTQWIFLKLYEKGLAYQADVLVNFCPALGTVLANEEVENGVSIVGGHPVERRPLRQWVLKITAYAQRLLDDLDQLDWPEGLKKLQRNWIGRSEGARVHFGIAGHKETLEIFTTRHDTIYGVTFMVVSPEHSLLKTIVPAANAAAVAAYQKQAASKSDLERTDLAKHKTGVFTGAYAINPLTGTQIPIWVADYVLMGYGTGAIMAVPAHDERDEEFAKQYSLAILPVLDAETGLLINSHSKELSIDGLTVEAAKEAVASWLEKHKKGQRTINYKLRDWLFSRQRYWGEPFPILHLEDGSVRPLDLSELPLTLPDVSDYKPSPDGKSPLARAVDWVNTKDPHTGKRATRDLNTMPNWAGSCWYYLRFLDPENDVEAWGPAKERYWMPVDLYMGGAEHAVLHLLYARFWHKVLFDCGLVSTSEPFKALRNQGLVLAYTYQRKNGSYVPEEEVRAENGKYFDKATGEELSRSIDKMSKSKLNGVTPDDIVVQYGADTLRLYELFMGPIEREKIWATEGVSGCYRFLCRFYDMVTSDKGTDVESREALVLGHKLMAGVTKDIDQLLFNTAIAKLMEFINAFTKLEAYPRSVLRMAVLCLSPLAPHIAEELWQYLGGEGSIANQPLPAIDPQYLVAATVTYVVQVNGKLRGRFELPPDTDQDILVGMLKEDPNVAKFLEGKAVQKVVFVPNKLINIVV